jgi:hypothetical protein
MTRQIVYLIKPHPQLAGVHELHIQYGDQKKKLLWGPSSKIPYKK